MRISDWSSDVCSSDLMTLVGADGKTADEMREVLGTGSLGDRWHKGVNALTVHIDGLAGTQKRVDGSKAGLELATANQLFGQRAVGWEQDFVEIGRASCRERVCQYV